MLLLLSSNWRSYKFRLHLWVRGQWQQLIILIQGYFAVFLSSVCVCVCMCVILCSELKWSVIDLLFLPPSLLPFSPLGCLTMATAVVFQFIPIYHLFHNFYGVHTEVCVFLMIGLYVMMAWSGDRTNNLEARPQQQGNNIRSITISFCFFVFSGCKTMLLERISEKGQRGIQENWALSRSDCLWPIGVGTGGGLGGL